MYLKKAFSGNLNMFVSSDTNNSPEEKEDLELLERVLEKALRVRAGSGVSQSTHNWTGLNSVPSKDVTSASSKGSQTTIRTASKSSNPDRKRHKKPGSSRLGSRLSANSNPTQSSSNDKNSVQNHPASSAAHHQATRKFHNTGSASASRDQISVLHSIRSSVHSGSDPDKVTPISTPSAPHLHTDKSGAQHSGYVFYSTCRKLGSFIV